MPSAPKRGKRVAIVGAGVCGLTCAHDLALLGYSVEVFESAPVPGGMLYLGIPHFRLAARNHQDGGRQHPVAGRDPAHAHHARPGLYAGRTALEVRRRAAGHRLNKGRELSIPGAHLDGVFNGIDFLINVNLGYDVELGRKVVVVGGGNVAVDVARAAVRLVKEPSASSARPTSR